MCPCQWTPLLYILSVIQILILSCSATSGMYFRSVLLFQINFQMLSVVIREQLFAGERKATYIWRGPALTVGTRACCSYFCRMWCTLYNLVRLCQSHLEEWIHAKDAFIKYNCYAYIIVFLKMFALAHVLLVGKVIFSKDNQFCSSRNLYSDSADSSV